MLGLDLILIILEELTWWGNNMKLGIYIENKKEKEVYLQLAKDIYVDGIMLRLVDASGERIPAGNLILFHADGRVERMKGINDSLGLKLDCDGGLCLS